MAKSRRYALFIMASVLLLILVYGGIAAINKLYSPQMPCCTYTLTVFDEEAKKSALNAVKVPIEQYIEVKKAVYYEGPRDPYFIIKISLPAEHNDKFVRQMNLSYRPELSDNDMTELKTIKKEQPGDYICRYVNTINTKKFCCIAFAFEGQDHYSYIFYCKKGLSFSFIQNITENKSSAIKQNQSI